MKKSVIVLAAMLVGIVFMRFIADKPGTGANVKAQEYFVKKTDELLKKVRLLEKQVNALDTGMETLAQAKELYRSARQTYKETELLCEYYAPATAKLVNGALVPAADEEEGTQNIFEPEGLQVMEEDLFSGSPYKNKDNLVKTAKRLGAAVFRLHFLSKSQSMENWQLTEAMKLELIRVISLGLSGFDSPASGDAMAEAAASLDGIKTVISFFNSSAMPPKLVRQITAKTDKARAYLLEHKDFDSFDRMAFITGYTNPLYALLVKAEKCFRNEAPSIPRSINREAEGLFETNTFNPAFYSPGYRPEGNQPAMTELGRLLFYDPVLSKNYQRSCASCHQPEKGFTDGRPVSLGFGGEKSLQRNAPGLINVAFQNAYFWDARVTYLEEQVENVVNNADELHGDFEHAVSLMRSSPEYRKRFISAFSGTADTAITAMGIRKAIAEYERSLTGLNSRFDRHIRNEKKLLSPSEINGFNLFMGKAVCGTCHFLPLFNGTVPPSFSRTEWEILGVPSAPDTVNASCDKDQGRYMVKRMDLHRFAFKTPTVRNAELTGPYMHNGVYSSLEQVLDFYNRGGGNGIGFILQNQTLPFDKLNLSTEETNDIVAFMKSLTDTTGLTRKPASLPVIENNPVLNQRKVGGRY